MCVGTCVEIFVRKCVGFRGYEEVCRKKWKNVFQICRVEIIATAGLSYVANCVTYVALIYNFKSHQLQP